MRAKTPKGERRVMGWMFDNAGRLIAWLQKPAHHREPFAPNDSTALRDNLRRFAGRGQRSYFGQH
jgi:hypothetical protein